MTDRERYLYDIQGFLVIRDFPTPPEVDRLNAAFDANRDRMGEDGKWNTGGRPPWRSTSGVPSSAATRRTAEPARDRGSDGKPGGGQRAHRPQA
jgi:hypothetical protein